MSDETSFCKHCKRFVPTSTFTLHFTHCERFIQICIKCQEPFPKTKLEEHDNEVHKEIECKDCSQKFEVRGEIDHLANHCPKRLISCKYCEVQCIAGSIDDHELACGSRTEVCDICRNHVLVRMLKTHEELHKNSAVTRVIQNPSNISSGPKEEVSNVEDKNVKFPKFRNVICQNILQASAALPTSQQQHSKNFEKTQEFIGNNEIIPVQQMEDGDNRSLLPCEFCGALFTFELLEKHQMLCSSNLEICSRCQKYFTFEQLRSHICSSSLNERGPLAGSSNFEEEYWSRYVEVAPAVKEGIVDEEDSIPCENCGSLFPISCLELHEIACKFASVSTGSKIHGEDIPTQLPATTTPPTIDEEYWSQYVTDVAPTIEDSTVEEEANIPCENCGIPFPLSSLELHEVSCRFSIMSARNENIKKITTETGITDAQTSHPANELTFIPCSFCNIVISSSILEMHEAKCSNFSKQQIRSQVVKSLPKKIQIRNTRSEDGNQRALRENALLATENRLPNTPKIHQSQYRVVQLPDGREILKKRNPTADNNNPDIGHVLGRGSHQHDFVNGGSSIRPKSVNLNPNKNPTGNLFDVDSNGMTKEIKKNLFQQSNLGNCSGTANRARNHYTSEVGQKGNYQEKTRVAMKPSSDHGIETRLSKKPNAAFANYAYQPDPGNRLGRLSDSTSKSKKFQNGNATVKGPTNVRDGELNSELQQQNERDRTNEVFLGARPKRPQP